MLQLIAFSTLNGVLYGMLLFMMASGLTLIFSMMGVLNFAHASFYMLGAYFGYEISRRMGFWPGVVIAPLLVGGVGAIVERYGFRRIPDVWNELSSLPNVHLVDCDGDVRVPGSDSSTHARRPHHPRRADASANGGDARPQRATSLHGRLRRRVRTCRFVGRHRRAGARHPALDGRRAGPNPFRGDYHRRNGFTGWRLCRLPPRGNHPDVRGCDQRVAQRGLRTGGAATAQ